MVVYLTSSFIPFLDSDPYNAAPQNCYGFFEDLYKEWPDNAKLLYIPCDPHKTDETQYQMNNLLKALDNNGLKVSDVKIPESRQKNLLPDMVSWADVIYLSGGHAPTQLAFMKKIGLREALLGFDGLVIGLGAGSINAAYSVYLMPELAGEAEDPTFVKFSDGLDLTNIQMIPHSEYMKKKSIDGLDFMKDVVIPDSYGRRFYLVTDGSYFKIKNGKTTFIGVGEIIEDGEVIPLKEGNIVPYMGDFELPVIKSILSDGFDIVFTFHKKNDVCEVYHLHQNLWEDFSNCKLRYKDICFKLSQKVVEEERESFLDQQRLSVVLSELKEKGSFVRTVHVDTRIGRRAKNIRIREIPGYPDWLLVVLVDVTTALDHDWMTDEYARTGFLERARLFLSELDESEHYSLVYTNVKGFKAVNELFGDAKGDMVIFQTRDVLRKYLKPVLMGRLESDHFVLITADENLKEKNLKTMCRQVFKNESKKYSFEIRCGIYSISGRSGVEITQLIAGAKLAEKSITTGEKNHLYAYYDDNMKENYVKQRFLLSDMERGIADNEFEPYYQPIVDAKTGEIVSAEMLIRWRHRDFGMVPPGDFVPVIESEGMISSLDAFMVQRGFELLSRRLSQGKKTVPCAINLSRVDFYDSAFIENIFDSIKEMKIDPSMVRFEVTESAYTDLEAKALLYLDRMKKQGIQILLDDYGSGMSSMSMMETFDFDIIKLDLGFVRKIGINDKAESIIYYTINLAHSIGARVTAEGVETKEQLRFLQDAGCDYIQGYYFYKPMSEADFIKTLDQGKE